MARIIDFLRTFPLTAPLVAAVGVGNDRVSAPVVPEAV